MPFYYMATGSRTSITEVFSQWRFHFLYFGRQFQTQVVLARIDEVILLQQSLKCQWVPSTKMYFLFKDRQEILLYWWVGVLCLVTPLSHRLPQQKRKNNSFWRLPSYSIFPFRKTVMLSWQHHLKKKITHAECGGTCCNSS